MEPCLPTLSMCTVIVPVQAVLLHLHRLQWSTWQKWLEAYLKGFHGGDALLGVQAQHALQHTQGPFWQLPHLLCTKLLLQACPEASLGRRMPPEIVVAAQATPHLTTIE